MGLDTQQIGQRLATWIAARHPEAQAISFVDPRNPAQGFSNETWLLDLHWQCPGQPASLPLVLRIQPQQASTFRDYELSVQYRCMEALQGSGVPVPSVFGYEATDALIGAPFYLMQRVDGQVPNENPLYHLEGWLHFLSLPQRAELWFAGIDCCAALARVDWQSRGLDFLRRPQFGTTPLEQILGYFGDHMHWAESLNRPYPHLHHAHAWLLANQPQDEPVVLCWGDAKLGNCVYRNGRLVAALDWEGAHLGSPVMDLAWWLTIDRCLGEGYGAPRLAGLPQRAASIARWEQASGYRADHFDYYEVFSAFKLASIMARIGTIYLRAGKVPADYPMDTENGAAKILEKLAGQHGF